MPIRKSYTIEAKIKTVKEWKKFKGFRKEFEKIHGIKYKTFYRWIKQFDDLEQSKYKRNRRRLSSKK